jgi:hypothetical protein
MLSHMAHWSGHSLATAVLGNLAKNFDDDFGACTKIYIQIEWEIPHMCENWHWNFVQFPKTAVAEANVHQELMVVTYSFWRSCSLYHLIAIGERAVQAQCLVLSIEICDTWMIFP